MQICKLLFSSPSSYNSWMRCCCLLFCKWGAILAYKINCQHNWRLAIQHIARWNTANSLDQTVFLLEINWFQKALWFSSIHRHNDEDKRPQLQMKKALVKFPSPRSLVFSADCIEKYCLLSLAKSKSGPFFGKKETGKIVGGGNLPLLSLLYRLTAIYCDKDDTVMFYVHIVLLLFSKTGRPAS